MSFVSPIPLALYIHLPWCIQKCPYCDFNSHAAKTSLPEELYIQALLTDFESYLPLIWGRRLVSIFFGGGTPSLFSAHAIEKILTGIHTRLPFASHLEITLEANPGTLDENKFQDFRKVGINRLSIGVQSLQNDKLKLLGRIHDRDYALRAIDTAKRVGFDNFNIDLMHGLPTQSVQDSLEDLRDALGFMPPHLSWYQLTIEPNTFFHHHPPELPVDEILWEIQEQGKNVLQTHGLQQYEVSAYSQPHHECEHNKNYWQFGDYVGIGAGAHSKITDMDKGIITHYVQVKHPKEYLITEKRMASQRVLSEQDSIFEFMLNALRLTEGVSLNLFEMRTGLNREILKSMIQIAVEKKLLVMDGDRLRHTELGWKFLNDLVGVFLNI